MIGNFLALNLLPGSHSNYTGDYSYQMPVGYNYHYNLLDDKRKRAGNIVDTD